MGLGSEYRITLTVQSATTFNTAIIGRNFRVTDFQEPSDTAALAGWGFNVWWPLLRPCLPSNVNGLNISVYFSAVPLNPLVQVSLLGSGTFAAAQHLPPQVATLIRLKWNPTSDRHQSKVFLPFIPVCTSAAAVTAYLAAASTFAASMLTAQNPFGAPPTTFSGVSWHRGSNTSSLLTAASVSSKYYTQRRRLLNLAGPVDQYPMA